MTSHEYAKNLFAIAQLFNSSPAFQMPVWCDTWRERINFFSDKESFLAAVRAIRSGTKHHARNDFEFHASAAPLTLVVDKDTVCRIVKPAVPAEYECDQLLTAEEEAEVGQ